jgi:4-oxalomesaconate tautomerase
MDFDLTGYESPEELDSNATLKDAIENLRLKLGPIMNLGDVALKSVPKMCLIAAPGHGGNISTRTFIPHDCHRSIGVLGAVTVATACLIPGSVTEGIATIPPGTDKTFSIEHPSGAIEIRLVVDEDAEPQESIIKAGVIRTARTLMRGEVFVPRHVWNGKAGES